MSNSNGLAVSIVRQIDESKEELISLSKFIHSHPEIALEEIESSAAAADFLEAHGFTVERGVAGLPTAFRASRGNGAPRVAYLAEYDALPGVGHGCGHNLIALAAIGAGVGLAAAVEEAGGSVIVFGTPAEEAVGGKAIMIEAGLFNDIDIALGSHPATVEAQCPSVEGSGQSLACQPVKIVFHGQSAHSAADPFNGVNALDALVETYNGINALRHYMKSDGRIHGIIVNGGDAPNVIPDYAEGLFYVRAQTRRYMTELVERVERIAAGAAMMTGARLEFSLPEPASYDMITSYPLAARLKAHLDALGVPLQEATAGDGVSSTDWGNVSYVVPSVETEFPIMTGVCTWHSQEVVDAADSEFAYEQALSTAKALALAGLDVMTDSELREQAWSAFRAERALRGGAPTT